MDALCNGKQEVKSMQLYHQLKPNMLLFLKYAQIYCLLMMMDFLQSEMKKVVIVNCDNVRAIFWATMEN